ncbi:MAG: TraR/DksA C4-type zinc finger protein [Chromatiales bacterium]|nr:TraR/DksA C4-type zinc finger protein [Chromatiales bacterium]
MDIADLADRHIEDQLLSALHRVQVANQSQSHSSTCECEDCGAEIPKARQQAVPGCTQCVSCAEYFERRQANYTRTSLLNNGQKVLDDYLLSIS